MIDISVIINLHNEGRLCLPTLESVAESVKRAHDENLECEMICVLDTADDATCAAVESYGLCEHVLKCNLGDLGEARNFGVEEANGQYVSFMDGDDLMGVDWLRLAFQAAEAARSDVVVHPRFNLIFGRDIESQYWIQPDMVNDKIDISFLAVDNLWTALCFSKKALFEQFPYRRNRILEGFGYEDWTFNFETVQAGILHIAPVGTIHFIRRKTTGSLLQLSSSRAVLPRLSFPDDRRNNVEHMRVVAES